MSYFVKVLADVLGVLYQNTGAALLLAALAMCIYILGKKQGAGPVVQAWIRQFRTSSSFRDYFFLIFYTGIILFHTLLCQKISGNPLANISGNWGIYDTARKLYTDNAVNFLMFAPLIILLFQAREEKDHTKKMPVQQVLVQGTEISFSISLGIELCQLFLKIGRFQLTDLFFCTLGGVAGGTLYWGYGRFRKKITEYIKELGGWNIRLWKPLTEKEIEEKALGTVDMTEDVETEADSAREEIQEEPEDLDPRYEAIEALVREAGDKLRNARPGEENIHKKEGLANFCTDYDTEIQRFLIAGLSEILPGAAFFGEEDTEGNSGAQAEGEFTFYIDPIDGTTNFMFDYHHSCISVGLAHRDQMIAGFVYHPYINEMYVGIRGKGSYLNGRRLTPEDKPVEEGIVEFGCARYNENGIDWLFRVVKDMFQNSLSIRCGGSAALGLCRAASGSNTVYLELKLQPYDYAAASVILEEAGGMITQIDGSSITFHEGCSIIGGTPSAWRESKEAFEKYREEK